MNVLLLGSGGREHALAWKLSKSSKIVKLYVGPGNAGTKEIAENVAINPMNFREVGLFCLENNVNILVVGPEAPLVEGISDYFSNNPDLKNIIVIGPGKKGALLEGSKDFAKGFMSVYGIPTAGYFTACKATIDKAIEFVEKQTPPYVLKADGLAAGKGVLIIDNKDEAILSLKEMLNGKFGEASARVVIEEFLSGIELSVFVLTNGNEYVIFPEAKDYKRIGEQDTGLNTGGMGAISPVSFADKEFMDKVENKIILPTINGLNKEGIPYLGFIFFGLIKVGNEPYVIEYNVRMGDPETEVVIPRLKNDLLDLFIAAKENKLSEIDIKFEDDFAATVMLVSGGYPGNYEKGKEITGLENNKDGKIFHAGTKIHNGKVVTEGGRVIAVTCLGKTKDIAVSKSLEIAEKVSFEKKYFRKDIGFDL
ncbi:MAG: phosphoribosylamine--glycine ligase [Bacteroidales bacterium]|nr:phosphoribosylamine--glycine ligase [Bacteroidales bacterium]